MQKFKYNVIRAGLRGGRAGLNYVKVYPRLVNVKKLLLLNFASDL